MATEHSTITDPQIHEPKGISAATADTVYRATGAGTGEYKLGAGSAYGELEIIGNSTAFALNGTQDVYTKLNPTSAWADNTSKVLTLSAVNGEITLTKAGTYMVSFWASFDTASLAAGTQFKFKYALDGVTNGRVLSVQKHTTGVDRMAVSASGIISGVTASQVLSIHAAGDATSAGTNITVVDAGLVAVLLYEG